MAYLDELREHFRVRDPYSPNVEERYTALAPAPPAPEQAYARSAYDPAFQNALHNVYFGPMRAAYAAGLSGNTVQDLEYLEGIPSQYRGFAQADVGLDFGGGGTANFLEGIVNQSITAQATGIAQSLAEQAKEGFAKINEAARGGGGNGAALANINRKIAEAREKLAEGNEAYADFMDTIAPGFAEAVDKARKAAKATAAIEQSFTRAEKNIDKAYQSASGRVRAIADQVAGKGNDAVASALMDTIFEMKDFIDRQTTLSREDTLALHKSAAHIAAATAQATHAGERGQAGREQYVMQKKYEEIISNLLRQRSQIAAAGRRARASIAEARQDLLKGLTEQAQERLGTIEPKTDILVANANVGQLVDTSYNLYLTQLSESESMAIPRESQQAVFDMSKAMAQLGIFSFEEFNRQAPVRFGLVPGTEDYNQFVTDATIALQYQDQVEIGARHVVDTQTWYNEQFYGEPTTMAGRYFQEFDFYSSIGFTPAAARDRTTEKLLGEGWFEMPTLEDLLPDFSQYLVNDGQ